MLVSNPFWASNKPTGYSGPPLGLFMGGNTSNNVATGIASTKVYNFTSNSAVGGTSLTTASSYGAAAGGPNFAIANFGITVDNVVLNTYQSYNWTTSATATGTIGTFMSRGAAVTNSQHALFSNATGGASYTYTYASQAWAPGGAITQSIDLWAGASDGVNLGFFGGGLNTGSNTISDLTFTYLFSSKTAVGGTAMTTGYSNLVAIGSGAEEKIFYCGGTSDAAGTTPVSVTSIYSITSQTFSPGNAIGVPTPTQNMGGAQDAHDTLGIITGGFQAGPVATNLTYIVFLITNAISGGGNIGGPDAGAIASASTYY
jgi:hypothetical protein